MNASPRDPAASPCVGICRMNAATGVCEGCLRTLEEIARWPRMNEVRKRGALDQLPTRRAARWQ